MGIGWVLAGGVLPRASLLGQVGTDMNDVVGDHPEPDPAPDSIRSSIERSSQSVPAFENADASLTARAPLLKLFEPRLFLPLLAGRALGVVTRNRDSLDSHLVGFGFVCG